MPITSNAKSAADRKAAKALITAIATAVGEQPVEVLFADEAITITVNGAATNMTRDRFEAWAKEGYRWNGDGPTTAPAIRPQPKPMRKTKTEPPAPKAPPAPRPKKPMPTPTPKATERKAADPTDVLDAIVIEAFTIAQEERSGEHGRNVARFRRGELMLRLQGISEASKTPVKKLLAMVNERSIGLASQHSVPDFTPITEQEATTTRRVVQAFGSSGEFRYVNAVDPATGNPLVNDAGEPLPMPITEVAINKLYPLVEYADDANLDVLLSFAHRNTEKVVKTAKRVAKTMERPIMAVIEDVDAMRTVKPSPLGPEVGEIRVPPEEGEVLTHLKGLLGEAPESDIVSMKTSRAWYEGTWEPLRELFSSIARPFMPELVSQSNGQVSNVFILERIISQFYNPFENDGVQRVLGALVTAGDLTEENAHAFVNEFLFDAENTTWTRAVSGVIARLEEDDGLLDDDDLDIDAPDDGDFDEDDEVLTDDDL
jgi:hypothetical protein